VGRPPSQQVQARASVAGTGLMQLTAEEKSAKMRRLDGPCRPGTLALPLAAALLLAGCSGNYAPTLPSPDPVNRAPQVTSLAADPAAVAPGAAATITCAAADPEHDTLTYVWTATGGTVTGTGATVTWTAPDAEGTYTITCTVSDGENDTSEAVQVTVTTAQEIAD
jgi:PBP1b-binding outer membrane lipoprotein LpoB